MLINILYVFLFFTDTIAVTKVFVKEVNEMDNYNSSGTSEDTFGFIPPNLMFPKSSYNNDGFASKEEEERYYYHLDHDNEFHFKDSAQ